MKSSLLIAISLLLAAPTFAATPEQAERARQCGISDELIERSVELDPEIVSYNTEATTASRGHGPITIIEFFDYNCPTCRSLAPQFKQLASNPELFRLELVELGVFGRSSKYATHMGLALKTISLEDYFDYHDSLFSLPGKVTKKKVRNVLATIHPDLSPLEALIEDETVKIQRARNEAYFVSLGMTGTPGLIVDGVIVDIVPNVGQQIGCLLRSAHSTIP